MSDTALGTILPFADHRDPEVRRNVALALSLLPSDEAGLALLDLALVEGDAAVRAAALRAIGERPAAQRQALMAAVAARWRAGSAGPAMSETLVALRGTTALSAPGALPFSTAERLGFALRLGMPAQPRDWLRADLLWLCAVALAVLLLTGVFAWRLEAASSVELVDARGEWLLGAMSLALPVFWLWSRRRAGFARHLGSVDGLLAEVGWAALCGAAGAGVFWLLSAQQLLSFHLDDAWRWPSIIGLTAATAAAARLGTALAAFGPAELRTPALRAAAAAVVAVAAVWAAAWACLVGWPRPQAHTSSAEWVAALLAVTAMSAVALAMAAREALDSPARPWAGGPRQALLVAAAGILGAGMVAQWAAGAAAEHAAAGRQAAIPMKESSSSAASNSGPLKPSTREAADLPFLLDLKVERPGRLRLRVLSKGGTALVDVLPGRDTKDPMLDAESIDAELVVWTRNGFARDEPVETFDELSGCLSLKKEEYVVGLRRYGAQLGLRPQVIGLRDGVALAFGGKERLSVPVLIEYLIQEGDAAQSADEVCDTSVTRSDEDLPSDYKAEARGVTPAGQAITGGSVVVLKAPKDRSQGPSWVDSMDEYEGKPMTVLAVKTPKGDMFRVRENSYFWDTRWVSEVAPGSAAAASAAASAASR
jgi:hypothetical protein